MCVYRFLLELDHHRHLGSLVFDEIQKILTDSTYCEAFVNFHVVHKVKSVVFGLTESLLPSLYPALCELTGIVWKVIRTPSSRKELRYLVRKVRKEDEINPAILAYVNNVSNSYWPKDRAMIFC